MNERIKVEWAPGAFADRTVDDDGWIVRWGGDSPRLFYPDTGGERRDAWAEETES